jgi:hypothetical protein
MTSPRAHPAILSRALPRVPPCALRGAVSFLKSNKYFATLVFALKIFLPGDACKAGRFFTTFFLSLAFRYFYQSLQETRVKLAVSPQPRAIGEPVAVNTSQYLAVKVSQLF